jgi:hypothetical protein
MNSFQIFCLTVIEYLVRALFEMITILWQHDSDVLGSNIDQGSPTDGLTIVIT